MKLILQRKTKVPIPETQEYKNLDKIKWLNFFALMFILVMFLGSLWFVYANIYQTIGKVQTLLITNPNLSFEPIDFKLYNDTLSAWETRSKLPLIPDSVRDPFNEPLLSTSTPNIDLPDQSTVQGQI